MKFEPIIEKIDEIEYITYETKHGKSVMKYDNSLTIKENFFKTYGKTKGWVKLKLLVDKI